MTNIALKGYAYGSDELERIESYVDVVNNTCSAIDLITSTITVNEDSSSTSTFR